MSLRLYFSGLVFLIMGAVVVPALSDGPMEEPEYKFDFDPSATAAKRWSEGGTQLPAYPKDRYLVEAGRSPTARGRLLVDSRSVTLGEDGVVRFAYAIESKTGVRNIFFEGLRCSVQLYKTYAYGIPEGKWRLVSDSQWQPIRYWGESRYRFDLARYYLCSDNEYPRSPRDIMRRIKYDIEDNDL